MSSQVFFNALVTVADERLSPVPSLMAAAVTTSPLSSLFFTYSTYNDCYIVVSLTSVSKRAMACIEGLQCTKVYTALEYCKW